MWYSNEESSTWTERVYAQLEVYPCLLRPNRGNRKTSTIASGETQTPYSTIRDTAYDEKGRD